MTRGRILRCASTGSPVRKTVRLSTYRAPITGGLTPISAEVTYGLFGERASGGSGRHEAGIKRTRIDDTLRKRKRHMQARKIMPAAALVAAALAAPAGAGMETLIECPFSDGSGDQIDRGFYIEDFPAPRLDRVLLKFSGYEPGVYVFSLTARASTFDGDLVGQALSTVPLGGDHSVGQVALFDFHGVPAPQGGIVTFAIT
jgi:hypothetical protein